MINEMQLILFLQISKISVPNKSSDKRIRLMFDSFQYWYAKTRKVRERATERRRETDRQTERETET